VEKMQELGEGACSDQHFGECTNVLFKLDIGVAFDLLCRSSTAAARIMRSTSALRPPPR
jgi:hypothetical protein